MQKYYLFLYSNKSNNIKTYMLLEELSKKDKFWRSVAYNICGNKAEADEIVQEMYLRRYDNDRGQEFTDYYIIATIKSIFLNRRKSNNQVLFFPEIRDSRITLEQRGTTDEEAEYLQRVNSLSFQEKELLALSYDLSLREIEKEFNINYAYVYRTLKKAREKILGSNIHKYKNKRYKHRNMEAKKSRGLGDSIEKVLDKTGIKALVKTLVGEECGCEERKEKLNRFFQYKHKPRCLTEQEIKEWQTFKEETKAELTGNGKASGSLSVPDMKYICDFYSEVFNLSKWQPTCFNCSGTVRQVIDMMYRLETVVEANIIAEQKKDDMSLDLTKRTKTTPKRKAVNKQKTTKREAKTKQKGSENKKA